MEGINCHHSITLTNICALGFCVSTLAFPNRRSACRQTLQEIFTRTMLVFKAVHTVLDQIPQILGGHAVL